MTAVLVSFSYYGTDQELKSSEEDIRIASDFLLKRGFEIHVVTDNSGNSYKDIVLDKMKNLFLYYTGHSSKNKFIFPSKEVSISKFYRHFSSQLHESSKIISVFDCCECSFNLAFSLRNGRYYLSETPIYLAQKAIHFNSCEYGESFSSSESYFTEKFFSILSSGCSNLNVFHAELYTAVVSRSYKSGRLIQTPSVTTSRRLEKIIWPWMFGLSDEDVRVLNYI